MITLAHMRGQSVGVVGLGKSGEAVARALLESGANVTAWDDAAPSREKAQNALQHLGAISFSPPQEWQWNALHSVVIGPGVPLTHPAPHAAVALAKQHGVRITGEVELMREALPDACIIGITGTNGKSTTTALIAHLLTQCGVAVQVGGNLGTPALSLEKLAGNGVYVLELSSYQLDLLEKARINIAVFLNLTPDHLDRHGDMAGYMAAKYKIFANQTADDVAILAVDDCYTQSAAAKLASESTVAVLAVSAEKSENVAVYWQGGIVFEAHGDHAHAVADLRTHRALTGQHNGQNAAAAWAAARALGLEGKQIADAMRSFGGLPHRLEWVGEQGAVRFYNDSKATNADATQHALRAFDRIYWILGGQAKAGGIASLAPYFPRIAHAFLIGEATEQFAATLAEHQVPFTRCGQLRNATEQAAKAALDQSNTPAAVVLSPACASWDQWKNFEQRGDAFRDYVAEILSSQGKKAHA